MGDATKTEATEQPVGEQTLLPQHRRLIEASAIAPDVARERGYYSETDAAALGALGFAPAQRRAPCLVLPLYTTAGVNGVHEIRPDRPRVQRRDGKERPIKYERPTGVRPMVDAHPRTAPVLGDPSVPLLIGEGVRKGDAALSAGFHCLNLTGVYGFRGTNAKGGKCTLADFDDIALDGRTLRVVFDSDLRDNPQVRQAAGRLRALLVRRGARVVVVFLPPGPDGAKVGLDDFLAAGGDLAALIAEAEAAPDGVHVAERLRYALDDVGNAKRFAGQHGEDLRFAWLGEDGVWHAWTGTHWEPGFYDAVQRRAIVTAEHIWHEADDEPDEEAKAAVVKHAHRTNHGGAIKNMIVLARSDPRIATRRDAFDRDPYLLSCANGTLDLRTGELHSHRREELITRAAPVAFDPGAPCRRFEAFLARIFADDTEMVGFVQRALGYSLTGDTGERKFFLAEGSGANGKGTLFNLVADILGPYAWNAPDALVLARRNDDGAPRNDIAALAGKRFVIASETGEGKRLDEPLVKRLTGNDKVTARFLHKEHFEFYPEAKFWWFTNHLPVVTGSDNAIWDRVCRIPFAVRIPEQERIPNFHRRLFEEEAAGVLAWLVRGCLTWQQEGLRPPGTITAATTVYRSQMDTLAPFIEDRCEVANHAQVPSGTLYAAFKEWAEAAGERQISQKKLTQQLEDRGFSVQRVGHARTRTFFGIGLRADVAPPFDGPDGLETPESKPNSDDMLSPPGADASGVRTDATACFGNFESRKVDDVSTKNPKHASASVLASASVRTPYTLVTTDVALAAVLPDLRAAAALGFDTETTALSPRDGRLRLIQLADRDGHAYVIDADVVDVSVLAPLFEGEIGPTLVGHNLAFEVAWLRAAGLPVPPPSRLFDTMLAAQLLSANGRHEKPTDHGLGAVAARELGRTLDKEMQTADWSGELTERHLAYAATDAAVGLPLRAILDIKLADEGLDRVAAIEHACLPAVAWVEEAGAPLDAAAWSVLR
ncbi:MAG: phage/plasmid primase, P4 family, partial [Chloroflexota bacterium]|nr:phage/plasmid primase, P4 family [Chloroflexota bacterium]